MTQLLIFNCQKLAIFPIDILLMVMRLEEIVWHFGSNKIQLVALCIFLSL